MDPASPPGWKTDQREFADWSDGYTSETCSSISSSMFTDVDENENENENDDTDEVEGHVKSFEYYKLIQVKKVYKVILEEEDLIN